MIETVNNDNFAEILPLIESYQAFYQVPDIDPEKNRRHFSRFLNDHSRGILFLFRHQQQAVGFATIYYTFSSSRAEEVGVLNDLFVLPEQRGHGIGRQLIEHAATVVKEKGLSRLQWLTANSNTTAQRFYEKAGAKKSDWFFYAKDL